VNPSKPAGRAFALYLVLFSAIWTAYVLLVYRHVQALGEGGFLNVAAGFAVRLIVWVAPVFLMFGAVDRGAPLRALGLVDHWKRGLVAGIALSGVLLAASWLRFGSPHDASSHLSWSSVLGPSLATGFFEEIPFRGFILQQFCTRMNFWPANGLTSLIFAGFHLPGWLMLDLFSWPLALNIFAISFALGLVLRYSRSLWGCIISHDANNFISFVLYHGR